MMDYGVYRPLTLVSLVEFKLKSNETDRGFHSCVYTVRQDVIRLISARRSRKEEEKIYEERIKDEETREKN